MQHAIKHDTQGSGNMESITPYCECGWRGLPAYAYNDDQLTDVRRQGDRHLKSAVTQPTAWTFADGGIRDGSNRTTGGSIGQP